MIKSYAFFDGHGNQITRGWQGHEDQAAALTQVFADDRGITVEVCEEPCAYDYENDKPCEPVCVCEPACDED
jgi:hypothetical protein